jgi:ATP-dependent Clp protease protease subunit
MLNLKLSNRPQRPAVPARANRKWFEIKNAAGSEADIRIYGEIGWPYTSAEYFIAELEAITAPTINLRINSPGGDIFDGIAIFNAIDRHPSNIIAHIDGLAASTASWLAVAADEVRIAANGYMMIHDPWAVAYGTADEIRKTAEVLDKLKGTIAEMYAEKSGQDAAHFLEQMSAETWYTAQEAVDEGLADQVGDEAPAATQNRFDLSAFNRVPATLKDSKPAAKKNQTQTIRDVEDILRDAGFSNAAAKAIASGGFKAASDPRDEAAELVSHFRSLVAAM